MYVKEHKNVTKIAMADVLVKIWHGMLVTIAMVCIRNLPCMWKNNFVHHAWQKNICFDSGAGGRNCHGKWKLNLPCYLLKMAAKNDGIKKHGNYWGECKIVTWKN